MKLLGRRIRSGDPLLLVESDRVDDQRIPLPMTDGMAQERRSQIITRWMLASIHIDHTPGMRARNIQDENALQVGRVDNLKTRRIEKCRSCARLAVDQWRVQVVAGSPILIQRSRPW